MKLRALLYALGAVAFASIPFIAMAAASGLVPCGAGGAADAAANCNLCTFGQLLQNIINFAIGLSIPISAILFSYAGWLYFSNRENTSQIEKAHKIFSSVLIGFVIAVGGWLMVQTILKTLAPGYQSWTQFQCNNAGRTGSGAQGSVTPTLGDLFQQSGVPKPTVTVPPVSTGYSNFYGNDIAYSAGGSGGSSGYSCGAGYSLDNGTGYTGEGGQTVNSVSCVKTDSAGNVTDEVAPTCRSGYEFSDGISDPAANGYRGLCVNSDSGTVAPVPITEAGYGTGSSGGSGNSGAGTQQWQAQLTAACQESGLTNCTLAQSIMANESGGRPGVISPSGAVGLMQVLPTTACSLEAIDGCSTCVNRADNTNGNCGQVVQALLDPTTNMSYGTLELQRLTANSRTSGDPGLVAAAYNGGLGAVAPSVTCSSQLVYQCTANTGYNETRNYVGNVLGTYNKLQ